MTIDKPVTRTENPNFSSGPCAKRPNWSLDALKDAPLLGEERMLFRLVSFAGTAALTAGLALVFMTLPAQRYEPANAYFQETNI